MEYLNKTDVILINQATLEEHGGNFMPPSNFLHESNLDYLLEAVQSEMFGVPIYPEMADKAAVYMFNIVCNHVFTDGNKRTGLAAAIIFLNINGYDIVMENHILEDFTVKIASGKSDLEECRAWFKENIQPLV
jgi:death on curing protein